MKSGHKVRRTSGAKELMQAQCNASNGRTDGLAVEMMDRQMAQRISGLPYGCTDVQTHAHKALRVKLKAVGEMLYGDGLKTLKGKVVRKGNCPEAPSTLS